MIRPGEEGEQSEVRLRPETGTGSSRECLLILGLVSDPLDDHHGRTHPRAPCIYWACIRVSVPCTGGDGPLMDILHANSISASVSTEANLGHLASNSASFLLFQEGLARRICLTGADPNSFSLFPKGQRDGEGILV